jgi:hypothetical protein
VLGQIVSYSCFGIYDFLGGFLSMFIHQIHSIITHPRLGSSIARLIAILNARLIASSRCSWLISPNQTGSAECLSPLNRYFH